MIRLTDGDGIGRQAALTGLDDQAAVGAIDDDRQIALDVRLPPRPGFVPEAAPSRFVLLGGGRVFVGGTSLLAEGVLDKEQAREIVANEIPYRVAATVVTQMTPTVLLALIDRMSPQELINNVASLKRRGAFENPELKALIESKLEEAKSNKRVSALKAGKALESAPVSADVRAKLENVADTQIKAKGRISRSCALLVDKSGSMAVAIEVGKRIAAMISAICEKELYVYAFDSLAYPIERAGDDLASWEKAFRGIKASGNTSCGVALQTMQMKKQAVEQIIMVTDEGDNTAPCFVAALKRYRKELGIDPAVCFVRTPGASTKLEFQ